MSETANVWHEPHGVPAIDRLHHFLLWHDAGVGLDIAREAFTEIREQLAAARAQVEAMRKALEGLVGETDPEVLSQMEALLAAVPHPDQSAILAAVRVLHALAAQEGA